MGRPDPLVHQPRVRQEEWEQFEPLATSRGRSPHLGAAALGFFGDQYKAHQREETKNKQKVKFFLPSLLT